MYRRTGAVLGLLLAVNVAGCAGADNSHHVATGGKSATATSSPKPDKLGDQERALKFAKCMREHGVDMPDPKFAEGGGVSINVPNGTDPAKVDAARQACQQYLPNGGVPQKADPRIVAQLRKFSQCMREHGIANFPDPTDQGLQIDGNKLGMGPDDPRFQAAQKACEKYQPAPPSGAPGGGLQTGGGE